MSDKTSQSEKNVLYYIHEKMMAQFKATLLPFKVMYFFFRWQLDCTYSCVVQGLRYEFATEIKFPSSSQFICQGGKQAESHHFSSTIRASHAVTKAITSLVLQ